MVKPILAWPTAGIRASLANSIKTLVKNARKYGHSPRVFIASDNKNFPKEGFKPEVLELLLNVKKELNLDFSISTIESRERFIQDNNSFDKDLLSYALLPPSGGGWGVNVNAALLHSAGKDLICTDDDVISNPAVYNFCKDSTNENNNTFSIKKDPVFSDKFINANLFYFLDRESILSSIKKIDLDLISYYKAHLRNFEQGRVLLINPGLYGESGMGSARGRLSLDGISRKHLMEGGYENLRYSRELIRIPEIPTISTSVNFMAGHFAADNSFPIPPFLPHGRNSDGLCSLITRIIYPNSLNAFLDFGLFHNPPERGQHSNLELTGFTPCFPDMVMALAVAIAPDKSIVGYEERYKYLGKHFSQIANLKTSDFVDVFYTTWSYQFNSVIAELESLLEKYDSKPKAWANDTRANIESINYFLREPTALFGPKGCGLTISEAQTHLDLYGGLLEIWPSLWEASFDLSPT